MLKSKINPKCAEKQSKLPKLEYNTYKPKTEIKTSREEIGILSKILMQQNDIQNLNAKITKLQTNC